MKYSQFYLLLANLFLIGSLLTNHVWDSFFLLGAFLFNLLFAVMSHKQEQKLDKLKCHLKRIKEDIFFEAINQLLEHLHLAGKERTKNGNKKDGKK